MNTEEFVSFWSQRYDAKRYDEKTCTENIGEVTRERILKSLRVEKRQLVVWTKTQISREELY